MSEALNEEKTKEISLSSPRLDALEKLYVKAYLHTLSHIEAHRTTDPTKKVHSNDNIYSRRANVQFYISKALQNRAEALDINPSKIMELLYHEATSYGSGTNQTARIQALNILGKQLGLFQEKVNESTAPIINIVHYQHPTMNKPNDSTSSNIPLPVVTSSDSKTPTININSFHNEIQSEISDLRGDISAYD
jgi:hypothetical protein